MFAASTAVEQGERLLRVASGLLRDFAARTAACDQIGDVKHREWIQHPRDEHTYYAEVRWGSLCKVKLGRSWTLSHFWNGERGARILARGDRSYIERYAQEVAVFGPPGGPEYNGEEIVWAEADGGTQHGATIGGEFRVMPVGGERGLLLYAGNDYSIAIVDLGEREDLQRTAEERRADRRLEPLRVRIGDEPVELHGLGASSVVGYLEFVHGAHLVLLHLEDEKFGLFWIYRQRRRCLRIYTLAELRHGDLECSLDWGAKGGAPTRRDVESRTEAEAEPRTRPDVESGTQREEPRTRPGADPPARPVVAPVLSPAPRKLAAQDLRAVLRLLDPREPSTGEGSTMVPDIEMALRILVPLGLGSQLVTSRRLRDIFAERCRVHLVGSDRTFVRAMIAVAERNHLFVRVGRRWRPCLDQLLVPDSELLRWIWEVTPGEEEGELVEGAPGLAAEIVGGTGLPVEGGPSDAPPLAAGVTEERDTPAAPDEEVARHPASVEAGPEATEGEPGPDSPDGRSTRRRRDGRSRLTLRFALPADQAASQFQGRTTRNRGPPRG